MRKRLRKKIVKKLDWFGCLKKSVNAYLARTSNTDLARKLRKCE